MKQQITPAVLADECGVSKERVLEVAKEVLNFRNVYSFVAGSRTIYVFNEVQAEKIYNAIKGDERVDEQVDVIPVTVEDAPTENSERSEANDTREVAKMSDAAAETVGQELFDVPQNEKRISTKELANILGVDVKTIQRTASALFDPSTVLSRVINGGKSLVFTGVQATVIKQEIQKHHNLPSRQIDRVTNELEENETIFQAVCILRRRSEEYKKRAEAAEARNATLEPKGDAYDALMSGDGTYSVKEVAKMLHIKGVGQNNLFKILRERKYLMMNNLPYQNYVEQGLFVVKAITTLIKGKNVNMTMTRVTPKGLDWLRKDLGDVA